MSLPSTITRRRRWPSITVIFNMPHVSCPWDGQHTYHGSTAGTTLFSMRTVGLICEGRECQAALTVSVESNIRNNRGDRRQVSSSGPGELSDSSLCLGERAHDLVALFSDTIARGTATSLQCVDRLLHDTCNIIVICRGISCGTPGFVNRPLSQF